MRLKTASLQVMSPDPISRLQLRYAVVEELLHRTLQRFGVSMLLTHANWQELMVDHILHVILRHTTIDPDLPVVLTDLEMEVKELLPYSDIYHNWRLAFELSLVQAISFELVPIERLDVEAVSQQEEVIYVEAKIRPNLTGERRGRGVLGLLT